MRKTKRLVLSFERLRNLTPRQLGRAVGGEPVNANQSLNAICNSLYIDCDTITDTNLTTNTFTNNTLTITLIDTQL